MADKLKSTLDQLAIDHADDQKRLARYKEQFNFWHQFAIWLQEEKHLPIDYLVEQFKEHYYES